MTQNPPEPPDRGAAADRARQRSAQMRAETSRREARRTLLIQTGVIVVVAVVVVGIVVAVLVAQRGSSPSSSATAPAHVTSAGGYVVGDPNAPVTITLVEDFQCPVCAAFERQSGDLMSRYEKGSTANVEYRPIAFLDRMSTTEYSSRALNAAACVLDQDPADFKSFHDLLFANQPPEQSAGLPDSTLADLAVQAGADRGTVTPCIDDRRFADWVDTVTRRTTSNPKFPGTPWVLVDGTPVDNPTPAAIQAAVKAAHG